ncbi:hypothetical protein BDV98DRAFT_204010 [Pterulicium gracile]|uniref:Uncharacterized protein n=1 Tax=Pterulicium gracile TaxID=1884261 RepID=A0A5C3QBK7_9AGAR|nr:hypothetical protein BDV98DRAFT_204010 [Pterula gracilis]
MATEEDAELVVVPRQSVPRRVWECCGFGVQLHWTDGGCECEHIRLFEIWTLVRQILLVANQVLGCILLTLRTYALYTRDKRILAFMLTSMAGLFGVAVVGAVLVAVFSCLSNWV